MKTNDLYEMTISEASSLLAKREISSVELTKSVIGRIQQVEPKVKGFLHINEVDAIASAERADKRIQSGDFTPMTGIPGVIKDNMCMTGVPTTCASKILENFVPPYTATAVQKLIDSGAVLVGKANMDEFAMGSSTENSAFHPTHNPWDLQRVPGGSSGGSAAIVSAGESLFALGSDTGGSIRQPAAFCGVVGMKPTYGLVSRYGLVAFASSLDQIGPVGKNVMDSAMVLNVISGYDPMDSTSLKSLENNNTDYTASITEDISGMKIGVIKEMFGDWVDAPVSDAVMKAVSQFEDLGAIVDWDVSLPSTKYAMAAYYILAPSEASSNLARYDGVKYGYSWDGEGSMWEAMENTRGIGFGSEVKRRIFLGTYALSAGYYDAYYKKAQEVRTLIKSEFEQAFKKYDILVTPTTPTLPFELGAKLSDPLEMYRSDMCTIPANIAGIPAISLVCGFSDGLPIGLHLMGGALAEEKLLRTAYSFEQATNWHDRAPQI
ncbi:MAG: Asp-tRNA(Asn)/Glu-tRNA(Gln) amidotransferase subunit GatA [Dehalococcoidia bacterium]